MRTNRYCCAVLMLTIVLAPAQAAMVDTAMPWPQLGPQVAVQDSADELMARLQALGVDPVVAGSRVAALTPAERAELAARLDQLPAGGDVLGTLAFAALVLLLTDILGYTDVYSFVTRTVNGEKVSASKVGNCEPTASAAATQ
jgi:hypothetical protein